MPATVMIQHDEAHLYAFPAVHITRIWTNGETLNIALADAHPHHKVRLPGDAARRLVQRLAHAIAYYGHQPQTFIIDINDDGEMRVTATTQPGADGERRSLHQQA